jgi:hypothetical protein
MMGWPKFGPRGHCVCPGVNCLPPPLVSEIHFLCAGCIVTRLRMSRSGSNRLNSVLPG